MGKSGRHKKLTRQEKSKTQLKGVKKLLKAQNVVNPTLKVKKIVLREQLTEDDPSTPITKRHQNLQDILSTLHHHNVNLRKDAMSSLLEIITEHPSVLRSNLDKVVERVAALTSDIERKIRTENIKVAEAIFQRVEESQIQPYFPLILTHLQCSVTNLNHSIRYSSLPFIHLLVAYYPKLVASSCTLILPSLLSLISSSSDSKNKTTLRVELGGGGVAGEEKRLEVFSLLLKCLQVRREIEEEGRREKIVANDERRWLLYPFGYSTLSSIGDILEGSAGVAGLQDEALFKFIQSCISCLVESWMEMETLTSSSASTTAEPYGWTGSGTDMYTLGSDKKGRARVINGEKEINISSSAVKFLECFLNLLEEFLVFPNHNLMIKEKRKELKKYLFSNLPYTAVNDGDADKLRVINEKLFEIAEKFGWRDLGWGKRGKAKEKKRGVVITTLN